MKARLIIGLILTYLGILIAFFGVLLAALNQKLWIVIVGVPLGIAMCDIGVYMHRYARRQTKMKSESADLSQQISDNMARARALESEKRASDYSNYQG